MKTRTEALRSEYLDILSDEEYVAMAAAIRGHGWAWVGARGPGIAAQVTGIPLPRIEAYLDRCLLWHSQVPEVLTDEQAKTVGRYRMAVTAHRRGKPAAAPAPGVAFEDWVEAETGIPAATVRLYEVACVLGLERAKLRLSPR